MTMSGVVTSKLVLFTRPLAMYNKDDDKCIDIRLKKAQS